MRDVLTISIDAKAKKQIERFAKKRNLKKSDVVKSAINKYILHEEFMDLREKLVHKARKSGYFTDEDIFNEFS